MGEFHNGDYVIYYSDSIVDQEYDGKIFKITDQDDTYITLEGLCDIDSYYKYKIKRQFSHHLNPMIISDNTSEIPALFGTVE